MELLETLNRTMKLAMDEGRVSTYEEAQALFRSFRLRISVSAGFAAAPAAEAAVLTLLNAAPRTFLGGVELVGALQERCTRAWFAGEPLGRVAETFGVTVAQDPSGDIPTIHVGAGVATGHHFWLGLQLTPTGFVLSPDESTPSNLDGAIDAGVAGAGAALSEAFLSVYRHAPLAGHRAIRWRLPVADHASGAESIWLIGLGHLGQAFLWTAALAGIGARLPRFVRLTDDDDVSSSSLSTCLLVKATDVGRKKVDAVADALEALGVEVQRDFARLNLDVAVVRPAQSLAVIAVDNIALRRSLDRLRADRVLEAGIGDGASAFTRVQVHAFPGSRQARDIWIGDDPAAANTPDISKPAYQALLARSGDQCGTTLVAGRAVATPFVGAFAGALLTALSAQSHGSVDAWNYDLANL
jgi:hypothetical protein